MFCLATKGNGSPGGIQIAAPVREKNPCPLPRPTTTYRLPNILQGSCQDGKYKLNLFGFS